ncbi:MAG: hypothetical protein ACPL6C_01025 [bacterium]
MNEQEKPGEQAPAPYRRRYFKVGSLLYPLGLLDGVDGKSVCGFCGHKIVIYSSSFVGQNETPKNIFYGCSRTNCGSLPFYRVRFIDRKVFHFLVSKLQEYHERPKSADSAEIMRILKGYDNLRTLIDEHHKLLLNLTRTIYNIEQLLEKIKSLEEKIEELQVNLSPKENLIPQEDPFYKPLWEIPHEKLDELPLPYKRKVYSSLVVRTRFYDTYLILRLSNRIPVGEGEEELGKTVALSLNR